MTEKTQTSIRLILTSLLLLVGLFGGQFITAQAKDKIDAQEFHDQMRKLWEDHITWTRLVIVGTLPVIPNCTDDPDCSGVLADLGASTTRLLQNQDDIGDAVKPFYGDAAGEQLSALLRIHIIIAAQILQAAKNGDPLDDLIASWYDNAHDIALFLNSANPQYWPLEEMEAMLD